MKFAARVGAVVCGLVAGEAAAGEAASTWRAPAGEVVAHHGEGFVVTNDAAGTVRLYEAGVRTLQVAGRPGERGTVRAFGEYAWVTQQRLPGAPTVALVRRGSGEVVWRRAAPELTCRPWAEDASCRAEPAEVQVSRGAPRVLVADAGGPIVVTDARAGRRVCEIPAGPKRRTHVALSDDGERVAVREEGGTIALWATSGCTRTARLGPRRLGPAAAVGPSTFGFAGRSLLLRAEAHAWVIDGDGKVQLHVDDLPADAGSAALSPGGAYLVAFAAAGAEIRDARAGTRLASVPGIAAWNLGDERFSADGERMLMHAEDGAAAVVSLRTGTVAAWLAGGAALTDDGARVLDVQGGELVTREVARAGRERRACARVEGFAAPAGC